MIEHKNHKLSRIKVPNKQNNYNGNSLYTFCFKVIQRLQCKAECLKSPVKTKVKPNHSSLWTVPKIRIPYNQFNLQDNNPSLSMKVQIVEKYANI